MKNKSYRRIGQLQQLAIDADPVSSDNIIETLTLTATPTGLYDKYTAQPSDAVPVTTTADTTPVTTTATTATTTATTDKKWVYYLGAAVAFYALYRILK